MRYLKIILVVSLLTGCQSLIPKVQGLVTSEWQAQQYQRQDQLEVQWKSQSFSFLLYQHQQGNQLSMVALSLTGQQLFKVVFDGKKVHVQQRIDAMRLLPFDFLVRDILFATYPKFNVNQVTQDSQGMHVEISHQPVLEIVKQDQQIQLHNLQVPYTIVFSPMPEGLE